MALFPQYCFSYRLKILLRHCDYIWIWKACSKKKCWVTLLCWTLPKSWRNPVMQRGASRRRKSERKLVCVACTEPNPNPVTFLVSRVEKRVQSFPAALVFCSSASVFEANLLVAWPCGIWKRSNRKLLPIG